MSNRDDFVINSASIKEIEKQLKDIVPLYQKCVKEIKKASEVLLDSSNWKGKARDEWKDTYRVVEHYLDDDTNRISSIEEIISGFHEIYETLDVEGAKKVADGAKKIGKAAGVITDDDTKK